MDSRKIDEMLNDLKNPSKDLSRWEESFIESLCDQWDSTEHLSERQIEKLEEIHGAKA